MKGRNISKNTTPGNMEILIVGAGLGGLAAACCFAKDGHQVQGSRPHAGICFHLILNIYRCLNSEINCQEREVG